MTMDEQMIAVILAAGVGRRIAELTGGLPKSYLTLGEKRILDHQIDAVRAIGVEKIVVVIGYRSELLERDYAAPGITLVKNPRYDSTNVLASLWHAREHLHRGFYFMHADTYFDPSILADLSAAPGHIVLCVEKKPTVEEEMKVRIADSRIVEINKTMPCETAYGEFTGLAKIDGKLAPAVVEGMCERIEGQQRTGDFFEVVLQDLIDRDVEVRNFDIGDRLSIEIDFPEDYERAKRLYAARRGA
jgi:choline kinase